MNISSLQPLMPEIVMAVLALLVLLLDLILRRKEMVGIASIISVAVTASFLPLSFGGSFGGIFIADGYSIFFKILFFISMNLCVLLSMKYIAIERSNYGEYYALMMFSTLGMMIMVSAGDLILLYLGLELMALSTYVLAGIIRHDSRSTESALKYFLLGAFSSAILLYGITMIYGQTGTTNISDIGSALLKRDANAPLLISAIFMMVAFGFKVALAPFHMWAPDVYEGAPTPVTAFMSVGPKAAGFAVLGRVFLIGYLPLKSEWIGILITLSILTMAVGSILAIQQRNIKRMLAYSSVAHAGYAVMGIISCGAEGVASMLNYLFIYSFMNIGAFAVVIMMRSENSRGDTLDDYKGLAKGHPLAAAIMLIFMFSLTGIPPTAGFIGKFYLFSIAVKAGYTWLTLIAVLFSAVSAFFYLRVVMYMYMYEPGEDRIALSISPPLGLALIITTVMVLFIGIYPSPFIAFARACLLF